MRMIHPPRGAAALALSLMFACAGRTPDLQNDSGSLGTCGDSCSSSQIAASCSSICTKIAQLACNRERTSSCESDCAEFAAEPSTCTHEVNAFLRCAEAIMPTCAGDHVTFPGCEEDRKAANDCQRSGTDPRPDGGVEAAPNDDPSICPDIPRPTSLGSCSSGGQAGGAGDGGLECNASCQDNTGNLWEADCQGSTCTCTYNRSRSCTCAITGTGICPSCCPGTRTPN